MIIVSKSPCGRLETTEETESYGGNRLTSSQVFDNFGNVVSATNPSGVATTTIYEPLLYRPTSSTTVGIGTSTLVYAYSAGNSIITSTPPSGHVKETTTDATGKLIKATDSGGTLLYKYDSQGNPTTVEMGGDIVTETKYDGVGHRTAFIEPNAGATTYEYDAFGQLTFQKDNKDYETRFVYDIIGRTMTREGAEGITRYIYKKKKGGLNAIETVIGFNGINQEFGYDGFGRTVSVTDNGFSHGYEYDIYDNVKKETYPSKFFVTREYDSNSFLESVTDGRTGKRMFKAEQMDTHGNYSSYELGNGAYSFNSYDANGFPSQFYTPGIQNLGFEFDHATGNLTSRKDYVKGLNESFGYDALDRLKTINNKSAPLTLSYEKNGNISSKSDAGLGEYIYDKTKKNAVLQIDQAMEYGDHTQKIQYTPFHQPDEIIEHAMGYCGNENPPYLNGLYFKYGPDYERRTMDFSKLIGREDEFATYAVRRYNGNYEEDEIAPNSNTTNQDLKSGALRKIHYIAGGDGICAIYVQTTLEGAEPTDSIFYVYKDYLGSLLTFTNETPKVIYEQSFDAWGRYRNTEDWSYEKVQHRPRWMYRGYTGHEHLYGFVDVPGLDFGDYYACEYIVRPHDAFNLINMNGRLYDPVNGRMLSVDNYVQESLGSQGYNRYTYAGNNPLKYTDPSGEVVTPVHIGAAVAGGLYNLFSNWHNIDSWKSGLGYFGVGAVAGLMVTTGNIVGARGLLTGGNIAIQAITGHLPKVDFKNAPGQSALNLSMFAVSTVANAWALPGVAHLGGALGGSLGASWNLWNTIEAGEVVVHASRIVNVPLETSKVVASTVTKEVVAEAATNAVPTTPSVLGHIFRDAPGHVNPSTIASQNRYIRLFESAANNPINLNQSILDPRAIQNGVQGFTQNFRDGQIWTFVRNGKIFDAGINFIPR